MKYLNSEPVIPDASILTSDPAYVEYASYILGHSELADGLSPHQLAQLAAIGQIRTYSPGEQVCDEHQRGTELYIIDSGTLEIWLNPSSVGREFEPLRRIAELHQGQTCGELSLLDGGVRSAEVRAGAAGARLVIFPLVGLMALCEEDTSIGFRIMRNLAAALALRLRLQDMRLYTEGFSH